MQRALRLAAILCDDPPVRCRWSIGVLALALVACSFDGPQKDGDVDAGDGGGDCGDWTPVNFDLCALPAPSAGIELTAGELLYDTTDNVLSGSEPPASIVLEELDPPVRVIHVESFAIRAGVRLRVRGIYPLIIASDTTIEVAGALDASSVNVSLAGAGADPDDCATPGTGEDNTGGASGGGGGGNQGTGGGGGDGDTNGIVTTGGGGGDALPAPQTPRGGCSGAPGGKGGANGGFGGRGGGALQLSAATSITVESTALINTSGGGGLGGESDDGGGGGGGSGGFIGLDAPAITIAEQARLTGNGGGGGGGSANLLGGVGGSAADSDLPADGGLPGGSGAGTGGVGGNGATPDAPDVTELATRGAGGGGGGVGYILIWADDLASDPTAIISPSAAVTSPRR